MTLGSTFLPFGIGAGYDHDLDDYYADVSPETVGLPAAMGTPTAGAPIAPMLAVARRTLGGEPARVKISNPGDAAARVSIYPDTAGRVALPTRRRCSTV